MARALSPSRSHAKTSSRTERRPRRSPIGAVALIVAVLATALSPAASADATAIVRPGGPPLGGVNAISFASSTAKVDRELAWARALHVRAIRTEIPWAALEPRRQGQIDPAALGFADHLVARAASYGIKIVALLQRTPCWASSAPPALLAKCRPGAATKANAWPPRTPSAFASFAAFLAQRYGSQLAAIEIWNEPDQANEDYFAGPEKPQRYAAILRAAYTAIKRVNPAVPVLGASIVGSNGAFLKALYAAGIKGYYDGLSVHFYNLVLASLRSIHEVQRANGDSTPVWLNEFGWSSCWPRQRIQQEQACVTRSGQAGNLANTLRSLARTSWIAAEMVYELQGSRREDFGVLTETGARKPSFYALRSVMISPYGKTSPVTVRLARRNGRVIASGGGPVGDYMRLEAFRGSTPVYRALFVMNRFNRYSIALPKVLGTSKLRVDVFQYWAGTARAAHASI
jgi:polysaccharide biosynthesis protein PslG